MYQYKIQNMMEGNSILPSHNHSGVFSISRDQFNKKSNACYIWQGTNQKPENSTTWIIDSDSRSFISAASTINNRINATNSALSFNHSDYEKIIERKIAEKTDEFKLIFSRDEYIDGEVSRTQVFFESLYHENKIIFEAVFKKSWLHVFLDPKPSSLSDFILIAATLDYSMLNDNADIILVGSWSHKSLAVKDAILRAAESWQNPEHSDFLERMTDIDDEYLSEYKTRVIESLRSLV